MKQYLLPRTKLMHILPPTSEHHSHSSRHYFTWHLKAYTRPVIVSCDSWELLSARSPPNFCVDTKIINEFTTGYSDISFPQALYFQVQSMSDLLAIWWSACHHFKLTCTQSSQWGDCYMSASQLVSPLMHLLTCWHEIFCLLHWSSDQRPQAQPVKYRCMTITHATSVVLHEINLIIILVVLSTVILLSVLFCFSLRRMPDLWLESLHPKGKTQHHLYV